MFIRKQLIAKVKEEIFKRNLQNVLNPFLNVEAKDLTPRMVNENMNVMANLECDLSSGENSLYFLMRDLMNVCSDKYSKNYKFLSELGQNLSATQEIANTKLQRAFANSSETTRSVAFHLMQLSKNSVLVGGCVRDAILGKEPKDWDFATDAHYDVVEEKLKNAGFNIKEAGKQFLVMIVSKDGEDFEIAMFRKDGNYTDGRRPDSVEIGTIFDDAERRDFTINALSFNLFTEMVQDPNGTGLQDIKDKVLRFVGKADDRIKEDFLRVARFYRFLGRFKELGMTADNKSLKACRTNFEAMQKTVAPERLKMELEKMVGL
jgi:hypothetical protein